MITRPGYSGSVELDRPRTVYFYATSHCNSNCAYCTFRKTNNKMVRQHVPLKRIKETWLSSTILRTCGIVVQGGEITLHHEAEAMMKFFHTFLPKVTLLTNAVDIEGAKPLVPYATQVTISLDGPMHDRSRGVPGNLTSVLDLLGYLAEQKKSTTLQITLGPWNAKDLVMAMDNITWVLDVCVMYDAQPRFNIASDDGLLGISHYDQKLEILAGVAIELDILSKSEKYEALSKSMRSGASYIRTAVRKMGNEIMPCYSTSIYSTIGADGSVWMCQGLSEEEAVVGNIYKDEFDIIWTNSAERRKEYRVCQRCSLSCQLTGDIAYVNSLTKV